MSDWAMSCPPRRDCGRKVHSFRVRRRVDPAQRTGSIPFGNGTDALRLVAIEPDLQRQGHGRVLLDYVENLARRLGIKTPYVNAVPEAVGYYEKLGWKPDVWDEAELVGIASTCRQMSKPLTSNG